MSLQSIAIPIGNPKDISLRALEALKDAELVIGEERKVCARFLKSLDLLPKEIELLNEHSDQRDLDFLLKECKNKKVALISDCGTPGFCDPGADLIALCRKDSIEVLTLPGASSLMVFIGGVGLRLDQFFFRGFIPAKTELREKEWRKLKMSKIPTVVMDTPYRLTKMLQECKQHFPKNICHIGCDLTKENELFLSGQPDFLLKKLEGQKREFLLLITF